MLIEYLNGIPNLVLIDLGNACQTGPNTPNQLSIWQGSALEFSAPEQLAHRPCQKSDIWFVFFKFFKYFRSFGVFLFVLTSGVSPFFDENDATLKHNILNIFYAINDIGLKKLPQHFQSFVNQKFLNFLENIFVFDVNERPTANECLKNEWMIEVSF